MSLMLQRPVSCIIDLGQATAANYRRSRLVAQRAYRRASKAEKTIITGMISDCEFAEEWLETGRRPGNKRGVERRAGYQLMKLMDPLKMQAFVQRSHAGSPSNITDSESEAISEALSKLSARERECYTLAFGECFTHSQIANMLGISSGTVDEYVQRAQRKIADELNNNLLLYGFMSSKCHL